MIQQLFQSLLQFFTTPDKDWSIVTMPFMVLFIVFFAIFIFINRRRHTAMLAYVVVFSLFFAYKSNGWLMLLLPITTLLSWWLTDRMKRSEGGGRKALMWLTVALEFLPLLYFKYTNFFIEIFNEMTASNFSPLSILLPVGISFYSLQAVSYTVDVYKGKFTLDVNLLEYAFYLTFFPLLMAGPITRAEVLLPQVKDRKPLDEGLIYAGLWLIIVGLLKKALVADYIAQYNNWIFEDPTGFSGFEGAMGVLGYTLQIYLDFSGYSDMSIGIAAVMGFQLRENFNFPYQSLNLTEFWRRWHIALSTWFRDYVYIPLGGNRKGKLRTYLNSFITMLLSGLWHGASWMFVIWGAMHGLGLIIHKACKGWLDKIPNTWYVKLVAWFITFVFVAVAWVFFRSPSVETAVTLLNHIAVDFSWDYLPPFVSTRFMWTLFLVLGFALHGLRKKHSDRLGDWFVRSPWLVKLAIFIIVMQLVINFRQDNVQPFIYAQF